MGMVERHAKCRALVRKYYSDVPTREAMLERTLTPLLRPTQALLDAGCGDTLALLREYGPKVRFAAGVDLELPRGEAAGFRLARSDLTALPFRDAVFDVVVSRSVIEHLEHPVIVFNEFGRVLAPGGKLILLASYWDGLALPGIPLCLNEIDVHPSSLYGRVGDSRDFDVAARILAENPEIARSLITHRLPLDAAAEAFRIAGDRSAGAIKVVLQP